MLEDMCYDHVNKEALFFYQNVEHLEIFDET